MSEKPVRPDDSDCCGSGCKPCIFDVYEERLKKWEINTGNFSQSKVLDQIKYLPFLVTNIESFGEVLKVFHFQAVSLKEIEAEAGNDWEIVEDCLNIKSGEYLIMKGMYEGETISRSYTPVLDKESLEKGAFTIIVSLQVNGKMSRFLKELQPNSITFWRGPYCEFIPDYKSYKHILLFGGGTGIVPLYNIAKTIVEDDESEIWVNVFASFKTTDTIILRKEFRKLKDFWNFQMSIYITSQLNHDFKPQYNEQVMFGKLNETVIEKEVKKCGEDSFFVVVCGPEGFNHFVEDSFKKFGIKEENIFIFW